MVWQIVPLKGTEEFRFGMSRDQIRSKMPASYEQVDEDIDTTSFDQYFELGVTFHYNSELCLDGIELYRPESAIFHGVDLLSLTRGEANALLTKLDPETRVVYDDATAYGLSLAVIAEDPGEIGDDAPVETVAFGVSGFFGDPDQDFSTMDVWELADGLGVVAQEFVRQYFGERPDREVDLQPG